MKEALDALKKQKASAKGLQNKSVIGKAKKWIRIYGFRTTKFARDKGLDRFTRLVYQNIKNYDGLELANKDTSYYCSEDDFVFIYESAIQDGLSERRQYCQSQAMEASESEFCAD